MFRVTRCLFAVLAMTLILSPSIGSAREANSSHVYACGRFGYSFSVPVGWQMVKPDALHCAEKASDLTSQSSPTFRSAAGRAFLQVDVINNKHYGAAQWIKDYAGLLGVAQKSIKVTTTMIGGKKFSVMAGPVSLKSSSGAATDLFLALGGIQYKGNMYGFVAGASLDHNAGAAAEVAQMRSAFTSLRLS